MTAVRQRGAVAFDRPGPLHLIALVLLGVGCAALPAVVRYPQDDCAAYLHARDEFKASIRWCLRYAEVREGAMEVRVSWEVVTLEGKVDTIFQLTDESNPHMYLTDEFGQRYDHVRVSGAALGSTHLAGSLREGSFFFPLGHNRAGSVLFHDDENGVALRVRR